MDQLAVIIVQLIIIWTCGDSYQSTSIWKTSSSDTHNKTVQFATTYTCSIISPTSFQTQNEKNVLLMHTVYFSHPNVIKETLSRLLFLCQCMRFNLSSHFYGMYNICLFLPWCSRQRPWAVIHKLCLVTHECFCHIFKIGVCPIAYLYANYKFLGDGTLPRQSKFKWSTANLLVQQQYFSPTNNYQIQACILACVHLDDKERLSLYLHSLYATVSVHCGTGLFHTLFLPALTHTYACLNI